jgi:glycylpeptide N-tetradecanoyltransferase
MKFELAPDLSEEEVAHWLLPREGVIDSFVITSPEGRATDFCR